MILSVAGAMLLGAAVAAFVSVNNRSEEEDFFNDNVAALASGEGDKDLYAYWANDQYGIYCCGRGNVRDCRGELTMCPSE